MFSPIDVRVDGKNDMMETKKPATGEMLQGTLDMLILRTLVMGQAHGHTIARVIENTSDDVLQVEQGCLYPALHRLEDRGWEQVVAAIGRVLDQAAE